MPSRRQRKLDTVVAKLQLQYGPRAIRKAPPAPEPAPHLPTGFANLDAALSNGGLPRGRITEISGPATSGKVTLAAKALAAAQQQPAAQQQRAAPGPDAGQGLVAWIDLGQTCDPDYLHRCGLDLDRLLVVHPADGVDALAIVLHLVESRTLAALVFDSTLELRGANQAAVVGALERLATVVAQTQTVVIFLSEPRAQARTLAHVATVRLVIRREQWVTRGQDVRGYASQVEIVKHKLGRAGALVPVRITFNGTVRVA
jgi:recombination protein RecA